MGNITLEYSCKQGYFHISDLETICKDNVSAIKMGSPTDYLLIGVFDTYEEADRECARLRANGFTRNKSNINRMLAY